MLYLLDLGFFERAVFSQARAVGAHVLMRLKTTAKPRVVAAMDRDGSMEPVNECSLQYFVKYQRRRRGTTFDLDVLWGPKGGAIPLRLVGYAHKHDNIRWYLTTVPRDRLSAREIIEAYRLRWLIELLFRELKQTSDLGRAMTADPNAIEALTYGALLAHVVVRSIRIQASLAAEVPLEQLRPLACLHVVRAYTTDLVNALQAASYHVLDEVLVRITRDLLRLAYEPRTSRSRSRIAQQMGAFGA